MKALIILAHGFEDIEAVTPIDILRRAQIDVTIAGLDSTLITGARGVTIKTDITLNNVTGDFDALILPGGSGGVNHLASSTIVTSFIKYFNSKNRLIAAICAAPAEVLAPTGILKGKRATCFPGLENMFSDQTIFLSDNVVVDSNIITSRAAGTSIEFSLKIVEKLTSKETAEKIKLAILH